ncbi:hypothetical protein STEG23_000616, partial [Scotinomys teguina]
MEPGRSTNTGSGTMEVKAAAPRCQLLLILLMSAVMLLLGTNGSLLLVQRTVTRTIVLQETIGKGHDLKSPLVKSSLPGPGKELRQAVACHDRFHWTQHLLTPRIFIVKVIEENSVNSKVRNFLFILHTNHRSTSLPYSCSLNRLSPKPNPHSLFQKDSRSLAWCLAVDLYICFHQLLDEDSMMTVQVFINQITSVSQL